VAECPEIGTASQGHTEEEALANLQAATDLYLESFPQTLKKPAAKFMAENGSAMTCHPFSVGTEGDGLPVIRANGGTITSQLVHEIESRTP
jgi:hypothetical protein